MKRGIPMELRPTQRFPEFIGQKLHDVRLGEVTEESTARNGSRLPPASVMGVRKEDGIVQMEGRLVAADISRYKLVGSNWFAYNPMRLNIGSIARWQGDSVVLVSPDYVVFRCLEQSTPVALHPEYLDHFRRSSQWDAFVNEAGDGGVRVRIYYRDISQLRLIVPDVVEQQKIADCLGSLDDLIAAEGRKLEALRRHKQGLMQQLFPQPGETVPRLRFPKFEGAGDWEEKQLSSLVKLVSGVHLAPDMYSTTGEVPYFTGPSDFTDAIQCVAKWTDESVNIAKQHDTLITVKGSGVGKIWYLKLPSIAMGRQLMAVRTEIGDRRFIYQFLSTRRAQFEALASGNLIPGLSRDDILGMAAYFPSRGEQKKIADCLGSLDDLIAAEGRKLEALRQHKQGLMQQLFPSLEAESR